MDARVSVAQTHAELIFPSRLQNTPSISSHVSLLPRSVRSSWCVKNGIMDTAIPKAYDELEKSSWGTGMPFDGAGDRWDFDNFTREFNKRCSFLWPHYDSLHLDVRDLQKESVSARPIERLDIDLKEVIDCAKRALMASQELVSLFPESSSYDDNMSCTSFGLSSLSIATKDLNYLVRSRKHNERKSISRKLPKRDGNLHHSQRVDIWKQRSNNPHRFFMWDYESTVHLTSEEESNLIVHVQGMLRLEDANNKLQLQLNREPTMVEWANAVDLSIPVLKRQLDCGKRDREKLINANLRMVFHTAKQYQGRGLSYHDLLQAGIIGLTKSIEKFRPGVGSRFSFYAFYWIRQTIRRTIFQHSRIIHLPVSIFDLLSKVFESKKSCFGEGNHSPSDDELASRTGISMERLERLLFESRMPFSLERRACKDQDETFPEIIEDKNMDIPEICVARELMRQHSRELLNYLEPNERLIVKLRYGIDDGREKSFHEIGRLVGCSKEGARKIQNRAMEKLKLRLIPHGLLAYKDLLV